MAFLLGLLLLRGLVLLVVVLPVVLVWGKTEILQDQTT